MFAPIKGCKHALCCRTFVLLLMISVVKKNCIGTLWRRQMSLTFYLLSAPLPVSKNSAKFQITSGTGRNVTINRKPCLRIVQTRPWIDLTAPQCLTTRPARTPSSLLHSSWQSLTIQFALPAQSCQSFLGALLREGLNKKSDDIMSKVRYTPYQQIWVASAGGGLVAESAIEAL